jgi:hypothetical protein
VGVSEEYLRWLCYPFEAKAWLECMHLYYLLDGIGFSKALLQLVYLRILFNYQKLDSPAVSALGVRSRRLSNALNDQSWDGWLKNYHLELLRASEGTFIRWSRLHLQSLAPTNPHWARGGLWPFLLVGVHKEGLCLSSGDINRLMMIKTSSLYPTKTKHILYGA